MVESYLLDPELICSLSGDDISKASDKSVFRLLPLIMSAIEMAGESCEIADRESVAKLLAAFRNKISKHRWTKLRFLLLAQNNCFRKFWDVLYVFNKEAYKRYNINAPLSKENMIGDNERTVRRVKFYIYVDIIDIQSVEFWTNTVHKGDIGENYNFPLVTVTHPFYPISDLDFEGGNASCDSVRVLKVFSSIARPKLVQLRHTVDKGTVSNEEDYINFPPTILVKAGDNLMQDSNIMLMHRCFNEIWKKNHSFQTKFGMVPYVETYECIPATDTRGIIEGLSDFTSLREFDWIKWADKNKEASEGRNQMLRTAAGAYVADYILGVRDRHFDNILIQNENTMFHIDYSYILGDTMPFDGAPISLSPGMEHAFRKVKIWENFVSFSIESFKSLRKKSSEIITLASILFPKSGQEVKNISSFLGGPQSLNTDVSESVSLQMLENQLRTSTQKFENMVKNYLHVNVVPKWYDLLSSGFAPATLAVELFDKMNEHKKASQITEASTAVEESEILHIRYFTENDDYETPENETDVMETNFINSPGNLIDSTQNSRFIRSIEFEGSEVTKMRLGKKFKGTSS